MVSIEKNKQILAKFEEFFSTIYKEKLFEIIEDYPKKTSIIIDYNHLKMFNPDLIDLLIENPEYVLFVSSKAIENIYKKKLEVRFKIFRKKITLKELSSKHVGNFVSLDLKIIKVKNPVLRINEGIFECRECMKIHGVEQKDPTTILEPSLCVECGSRSFKLSHDDSTFIEEQKLMVRGIGTKRELLVILNGDLADYDLYNKNDVLRVNGILKPFQIKNNSFDSYIEANYLEKLDKVTEDIAGNDISLFEIEEKKNMGKRNVITKSIRHEVLKRDNYQCLECGASHKKDSDVTLHIDHIVPVSQGGTDELENLQTLCQDCNLSKSNRHWKGGDNEKS